MLKQLPYEAVKNELDYLQSIDPNAPGKTFNHSSHTFAQYANMQANHFLYSGHRISAMDALQVRDIAKPDFRSHYRMVPGFRVYKTFVFVSDCYVELQNELRETL